MSLWVTKEGMDIIVNLDKTDAIVLVGDLIEFGSLLAPTGQVIPFYWDSEEDARAAFHNIHNHIYRASWDERYRGGILILS